MMKGILAAVWLGTSAGSAALGAGSASGQIDVQDIGGGTEFMSGAPVQLPAAELSTNLFGEGVRCIRNRPHCVRPAAFDAFGNLAVEEGFTTNAFPQYLQGQPYVWFLQNVRHYTNYACRVTVEVPATVYLLLDNRLNDFRVDSYGDDPSLGPPDTAWVMADGWERVCTGLSPVWRGQRRGDYVAIDEGGNGTRNQFYAVFRRSVAAGGSLTLGTAYEGNVYCLVIDLEPSSPAAEAILPR